MRHQAICSRTVLLGALLTVTMLRADTTVPAGTITSDTTWGVSGSPFIVACPGVTVAAGVTLTIQSGVSVKFGCGLFIVGNLVANGTAAQPITFTSLTDDATTSWGGIVFGTGARGSIDRANVRFGGNSGTGQAGGQLQIATGNALVNITNSTITQGFSSGLSPVASDEISGVGTKAVLRPRYIVPSANGVVVSGTGTSPSMSNNTFTQNATDIWVNDEASATIQNNVFATVTGEFAISVNAAFPGTLGGNSATGQGFNGVQVRAGTTTTTSLTWNQVSMPYLVCSVTVGANTIFTITPGVVVKFLTTCGSNVILVTGNLVANGTAAQPITLTSLTDDATTTWGGIVFNTGASGTIAYANVRFGGNSGVVQPIGQVNIATGNALVSITSSTITQGFSNGLSGVAGTATANAARVGLRPRYIVPSANGVVVSGTGTSPTITYSTISANAAGVSVNGGATPHINFNNIQGNTMYGVLNFDCPNNDQCSTTPTVDAANNYWGSVNGPSGAGPGTGDAASFHVNFSPYAAQPITSTLPPPSISSISPNSQIDGNRAWVVQGQTIAPFIVNGTNFQPGATVTFGTQGISISYSLRTSTQIVGTVVIAGDALPGLTTVAVKNPDSQTSALVNFLLLAEEFPVSIGRGTEPSIAVDNLHPLHAVIGFNDETGTSPFCAWWESLDGGLTSTLGTINLPVNSMFPSGFHSRGDPWVRYGPSGQLYFSCIGITDFLRFGNIRIREVGIFVATAPSGRATDFSKNDNVANTVSIVDQYCPLSTPISECESDPEVVGAGFTDHPAIGVIKNNQGTDRLVVCWIDFFSPLPNVFNGTGNFLKVAFSDDQKTWQGKTITSNARDCTVGDNESDTAAVTWWDNPQNNSSKPNHLKFITLKNDTWSTATDLTTLGTLVPTADGVPQSTTKLALSTPYALVIRGLSGGLQAIWQNVVNGMSQIRIGSLTKDSAGIAFVDPANPKSDVFLPGAGRCALLAGGYVQADTTALFRYKVWRLVPGGPTISDFFSKAAFTSIGGDSGGKEFAGFMRIGDYTGVDCTNQLGWAAWTDLQYLQPQIRGGLVPIN